MHAACVMQCSAGQPACVMLPACSCKLDRTLHSAQVGFLPQPAQLHCRRPGRMPCRPPAPPHPHPAPSPPTLQHPNIITYYEAFADHDKLCVVTELVMGGDLGTFIRCGAAAAVAAAAAAEVLLCCVISGALPALASSCSRLLPCAYPAPLALPLQQDVRR